MKRTAWTGSIMAMTLAFAGACKETADVNDELEDLREAQKNAPHVTQELQRELEQAKAEVVRLEKKLALAREGITDEVWEERQELQQALKNQRQNVRSEIDEAQQGAQTHNTQTEKAGQLLKETEPSGKAEAQVKTETRAGPSESEVQTTEGDETIRLQKTHVAGKSAPDASIE